MTHLRTIFLGTIVALCLVGCKTPTAQAPGSCGLPVAVEFGKREGDLSSSEVDFIAHNVTIAALQHFGGLNQPYACQEDGVYANAARLKAANPAIKVLIYWGFAGSGHMNYRAYDDPQFRAAGETWYVTRPGQKHHHLDITNPAMRTWWAAAATKMVASGKLDGLFIDGARNTPNDPWRAAKIELFKTLRADLDALNQGHKLVIINGNAMNLVGSGLAPYLDGVMIEWFDLVYNGTPRTPDQNLQYLQTANTLASVGKQVWLKAWPYPHNFIDAVWHKGTSYEQKIADSRAPLAWNVAAFLVAAVPGNSYLSYSWGYGLDSLEVVKNHSSDPTTWVIDPTWYTELKNNYGQPLGPMKANGYVLIRPYPGGVVRIDLANHTCSLPSPLSGKARKLAESQH